VKKRPGGEQRKRCISSRREESPEGRSLAPRERERARD
jgi:hypothetical protein